MKPEPAEPQQSPTRAEIEASLMAVAPGRADLLQSLRKIGGLEKLPLGQLSRAVRAFIQRLRVIAKLDE